MFFFFFFFLLTRYDSNFNVVIMIHHNKITNYVIIRVLRFKLIEIYLCVCIIWKRLVHLLIVFRLFFHMTINIIYGIMHFLFKLFISNFLHFFFSSQRELIILFFWTNFQPVASASDNNFLSSEQDTNWFLV